MSPRDQLYEQLAKARAERDAAVSHALELEEAIEELRAELGDKKEARSQSKRAIYERGRKAGIEQSCVMMLEYEADHTALGARSIIRFVATRVRMTLTHADPSPPVEL